jgi:FixJ family two-component response regulator
MGRVDAKLGSDSAPERRVSSVYRHAHFTSYPYPLVPRLPTIRPAGSVRLGDRVIGGRSQGSEEGAPPGPRRPAVFVVDDDVSVRESLELLIRSAGWQPYTFADANAFLSRPPLATPSCLVLDVALPDLNGLELQQRLSDRLSGHPSGFSGHRLEMPIIFITGQGDIPTTVQAMKAGAVEFLTKPFDAEVLLAAIRNALERSTIALTEGAELESLRARFASLSPREQDVMALVVSGLLNKQAGAELGISEITVKAHRGKVMRKMKADSLADLVRMAARLRPAPSPSAGGVATTTSDRFGP